MSNVERGADGGSAAGDATLVLAPGVSTRGERVCTDLLSRADAALVLAVRRPPDDWRARRGDGLPPTRFVTADPHPDSVRAVSDPGDLTGLGIAVAEYLDAVPADAVPAVCVDSATTLLQFADSRRVYRFLQVLCGRVLAAGGTVHCHVDPAAHDDRVLDRLASLFDDAVTVSAD